MLLSWLQDVMSRGEWGILPHKWLRGKIYSPKDIGQSSSEFHKTMASLLVLTSEKDLMKQLTVDDIIAPHRLLWTIIEISFTLLLVIQFTDFISLHIPYYLLCFGADLHTLGLHVKQEADRPSDFAYSYCCGTTKDIQAHVVVIEQHSIWITLS